MRRVAARRSAEGFAVRTLCRTFCAGLFVAICVPLVAQAPDRARTEALARRAGERLQALQREADSLAVTERTLLGDLRKLEVERQIRAELFKQADADVKAVQREIAATSDRMSRLQQQDESERPELRARLVETYKLGQGRYLRLLLGTSDLRRLGQAARAVAVMAKLDRDRVASHQQTLKALVAARAALDARRKTLETARADAARAQAAAEHATQARNDLVRDIDQRRDLNAQLSGELQAAQQKLQLTLRNVGQSTSAEAATPAASVPWRSRLARARHRPAAVQSDGCRRRSRVQWDRDCRGGRGHPRRRSTAASSRLRTPSPDSAIS